MSEKLGITQDSVGCMSGLDALERFLENHGDEFLFWRDGCVVIESYFEKQFRAVGGNVDRLIAHFEDYCNMRDASQHYIASLRSASNAAICDGAK